MVNKCAEFIGVIMILVFLFFTFALTPFSAAVERIAENKPRSVLQKLLEGELLVASSIYGLGIGIFAVTFILVKIQVSIVELEPYEL